MPQRYFLLTSLMSLFTLSLGVSVPEERLAEHISNNYPQIARSFKHREEELDEQYRRGTLALPIASRIMAVILNHVEDQEITPLAQEVLHQIANLASSKVWHDIKYYSQESGIYYVDRIQRPQKRAEAIGKLEKELENTFNQCLRDPLKAPECAAKNIVGFVLVNQLLATDFILPLQQDSEGPISKDHEEL